MEQNMAARLVADRVREVRNRRGLTARQLAERMTRAGISWDRGVVAKLETGRRQSLSVDEWLTLAAVLDVAPVHLLLPLEDDTQVQLFNMPGSATLPAAWLRAWISGYAPLPGQDPRVYWSEVPPGQWEAFEEAARREGEGTSQEVTRWLKTVERLQRIAEVAEADRDKGTDDDG
jgi:transcriptional regulator with XRE-family HTH domain